MFGPSGLNGGYEGALRKARPLPVLFLGFRVSWVKKTSRVKV